MISLYDYIEGKLFTGLTQREQIACRLHGPFVFDTGANYVWRNRRVLRPLNKDTGRPSEIVVDEYVRTDAPYDA